MIGKRRRGIEQKRRIEDEGEIDQKRIGKDCKEGRDWRGEYSIR